MNGEIMTIASERFIGTLELLFTGANNREEFYALVARARRTEKAEDLLRETERRAATAEQALMNLQMKISAAMDEILCAGWPLRPVESPATIEAAKIPRKRKSIEVQLMLLHAKAQGETKLEKAYLKARNMLGRGHTKNWRPYVGTLLGRTQGKHRKNFLKRCLEYRGIIPGDRFFQDLADDYSRIDGRTVAVSELLREARA